MESRNQKLEKDRPGGGLTLEISPLSFPDRSVALRERTPRWKCPII
jgi:hypothetical protein